MTLTEGIQDNTAMKYLKNVKQVLKLAVQRKWLSSNPLEDYVCTYVNPERDIPSIEELSTLYHKEFKIPRLQGTTDAYLFMALTGYAYKDALMLNPENISKFFDGEDWIVKNREKTWCRENVPLLPIAWRIFAVLTRTSLPILPGIHLPQLSHSQRGTAGNSKCHAGV